MTGVPVTPDPDVAAALDVLGKRRLVLSIHDASFPGSAGEDPGRGSPYSASATGFLRFVRGLGFDGVMLGPQGMQTPGNPSPYDASQFSRNLLNLDFPSLAQDPLFSTLGVSPPDPVPRDGLERVRYATAHAAQHAALDRLHARFVASGGRGKAGEVTRALASFRTANQDWLESDAVYFALAERHGGTHHRDWPRSVDPTRATSLSRGLAGPVERFVLGQLAVHRQHASFRARARGLGLRLFGDLQIGLAPCDEWRDTALFLPGYRLGAPPSRTNPNGQPWGYPVLDPSRYRRADGTPGPALGHLARRVAKLLDEHDAIRIDHPHGLVCPWVYRDDVPDPDLSVRHGARLFESPDLDDHPALAPLAIPRRDQIARDGVTPRHADGRVIDLDQDQVDRYGCLLGVVVDAVAARGGSRNDVVCEVLSTCPYPLARLLERYRLGRFRVTQKADVHRPDDVYRSENARPEDWVMLGNHDTPPIWKLAREWAGTAAGRDQAAYLARRLRPGRDDGRLAAEIAADPRRLVAARFADLFASPAAHVLVFFSDLLGMDDVYNRPGTVGPLNWTLRVPPDYAGRYAADRARGDALDLSRALATALRARGLDRTHGGLLERLERHPRERPMSAG